MEAPGAVPSSIHCHTCGATIELAGHEGFTHVECPGCGALSVVPLKFGNFLLLHAVGIGGVGTVYKAMDLSLNRFVALKILRKKLATNPEFIENFAREARAAAMVNHPNVAQVYSFNEAEGQYFLAMEIMERGSLDDRMSKLGKIPERDIIEIAIAAAQGLRAAHQQGLLHRDVKPGNILFNSDGVPKIVDFGLARPPAKEKTSDQPEPIWGTPYYIAPEKLRGQPEDLQSDIYSLGATLFHAIAGRPPYEGETAYQVASKHASLPAVSLKSFVPTIHEHTARVIGRMLAKNPAERYATYDDLIRDLNLALEDLKKVETDRIIVTTTGERFSVSSALITAVALIACAGIAWYVWTWISKQPPPPALPPVVITPTTTNQTVVVPDKPIAKEVDFNQKHEDGSRPQWLALWDESCRALNGADFDKAYIQLDSARGANEGNPTWKQWMNFYLGLTYSADVRAYVADEARASFQAAIRPDSVPGLSEPVTTANYVNNLSLAMLDKMALDDLLKQSDQLPPWAMALTILCDGLKKQHAFEFAAAAETYRKYQNLQVPPEDRWATGLQALASLLARRNDLAQDALTKLNTLIEQRQFEQARSWIETSPAAPPIPDLKPALESHRPAVDKGLQELEDQRARARQEAERLRQEAERERREAEKRKRIEEEQKVAETTGNALEPVWKQYDFNGALNRLNTVDAQLTTPEAKRVLRTSLSIAQHLVEFKRSLMTDIVRQPYSAGNLADTSGRTLPGTLTGASSDELVFTIPYGETRVKWTDLPPVVIIKLADYYTRVFASAEKPEDTARRYLRLAVFCKQYGQPQSAASYAQQALRFQPTLKQEINELIGPLP